MDLSKLPVGIPQPDEAPEATDSDDAGSVSSVATVERGSSSVTRAWLNFEEDLVRRVTSAADLASIREADGLNLFVGTPQLCP
jgi:hypothetical protein